MATTTSAPRRVPLAVTALCLVQFMDVLGVTVVVTALPSMLTSLHASQAYSGVPAAGTGPPRVAWAVAAVAAAAGAARFAMPGRADQAALG
jgi:MFS family permease